MAKIHTLKVANFRGIKNLEYNFYNSDLVCLVGRGDSGKTTILEAISLALSSRWNIQIYDNDFFECNVEIPIIIEITLFDIPERFISESKYGLWIRFIDNEGLITDDMSKGKEPALSIRFEVDSSLEPKWSVFNDRNQELMRISASDREMLNVFLVSDYIDSHYTLSKGSPLLSLVKKINKGDNEKDNIVVEALRDAKKKIDEQKIKNLEDIMESVIEFSNSLGLAIEELNTSIDYKNIIIGESKLCLHDGLIPIRSKGKGSKRLLSLTLQFELSDKKGIILIDEIEQGLEPDRVKHLVRFIQSENRGQVFLTSHSQNVIEEFEADKIYLVDNESGKISLKKCGEEVQGVLRACPEAVYAKKVIICEGKTEIGFCRALDSYRIKKGMKNLSRLGVVYSLGEGNSMQRRANQLVLIGKKVCVLCDSDDEDFNRSKESLKSNDVTVIDWDKGNNFERQILNDLPDTAIKELINSDDDFSKEIKTIVSDTSEVGGIRSKLSRSKIFKSIKAGEFLGNIVFGSIDNLKGKKVLEQIKNIEKWIDDD